MKKIAVMVLAALLFAASFASATSYVMMADEDLADGARIIARARVVGTEVVMVGGTPFTEYVLRVEEKITGAEVGEQIPVRVLGGMSPGTGVGLKIWGAPALAAQESVIAFLVRNERGDYAFEQLMLGVFRVGRTADGREVAVRDLRGSTSVQVDNDERRRRGRSLAQAHLPRDAARFAAWLRERAVGNDREPDYFLGEQDRPVGSAHQEFTLFEASDGRKIHWSEFTSPGGVVSWQMHRKGNKALSKKGENSIRAALAAWSKIFNVNLAWGGRTGNKTGFNSFDADNVIDLDDASKSIDGSFSCASGGVLAIGGPWFGTVLDGAYWKTLAADIVFQDGLECFFDRGTPRVDASAKAKPGDTVAEEISAHELGHTLGIGHSCASPELPCKKSKFDKALMRWAVHDDGRGAAIQKDDKKAAKKLGYKGS